eukprot:980649-Prorocentrum_minimum.AAC.1
MTDEFSGTVGERRWGRFSSQTMVENGSPGADPAVGVARVEETGVPGKLQSETREEERET